MEQSWGLQLSLLCHSDTTGLPGKMFRPQDRTSISVKRPFQYNWVAATTCSSVKG